jgi:sigma54-dependent transcription regulator
MRGGIASFFDVMTSRIQQAKRVSVASLGALYLILVTKAGKPYTARLLVYTRKLRPSLILKGKIFGGFWMTKPAKRSLSNALGRVIPPINNMGGIQCAKAKKTPVSCRQSAF